MKGCKTKNLKNGDFCYTAHGGTGSAPLSCSIKAERILRIIKERGLISDANIRSVGEDVRRIFWGKIWRRWFNNGDPLNDVTFSFGLSWIETTGGLGEFAPKAVNNIADSLAIDWFTSLFGFMGKSENWFIVSYNGYSMKLWGKILLDYYVCRSYQLLPELPFRDQRYGVIII
jgi:hypothetical protein